MAARKPKTLYHYCSLETFKSIMERSTVWLSDIRKSNDSKEMLWAKNQCSQFLLNTWVNYLNILRDADQSSKVTKEHFSHFENIRSLIDDNDFSICWAFCLSEKKDDLGQWRGYADDGQGISIGFSSDFFEIIDILLGRIGDNGKLHFQKICYKEKEFEKLLENSMNSASITADFSPEEVLQLCFKTVESIFWLTPFYKNESFKEEKEWRVAYTTVSSEVFDHKLPVVGENECPLKEIVTFGRLGYVVKNKTLVSHLELGLPLLKNILSTITLGPKCKVTPFEMQMFLASIGMDKNYEGKPIDILVSSATYQ